MNSNKRNHKNPHGLDREDLAVIEKCTVKRGDFFFNPYPEYVGRFGRIGVSTDEICELYMPCQGDEEPTWGADSPREVRIVVALRDLIPKTTSNKDYKGLLRR